MLLKTFHELFKQIFKNFAKNFENISLDVPETFSWKIFEFWLEEIIKNYTAKILTTNFENYDRKTRKLRYLNDIFSKI